MLCAHSRAPINHGEMEMLQSDREKCQCSGHKASQSHWQVPTRNLFTQLLLLKPHLLWQVQKTAGDLTLGEVVWSFKLNYSDVVSAAIKAHAWKIEDEKHDFPMTLCISNLCFPSALYCTDGLFDKSTTDGKLFKELWPLKQGGDSIGELSTPCGDIGHEPWAISE